jgi:hypothetical protein
MSQLRQTQIRPHAYHLSHQVSLPILGRWGRSTFLSSAHAWWADSGALWSHMSTAMGPASHGEAGKHEEKPTFSASNSLILLYGISANIGQIRKIPTEELIPVIFLTLTLPYYFFEMVNVQGVMYPLSTTEMGALLTLRLT